MAEAEDAAPGDATRIRRAGTAALAGGAAVAGGREEGTRGRRSYLVHLTSVTASRELLRKQLAKVGLSDTGGMGELLVRYREFVLRFNANLDAAAPRTDEAVVEEVRHWERALAAERAKAERRGKGRLSSSSSWWQAQRQPAAKRLRASHLGRGVNGDAAPNQPIVNNSCYFEDDASRDTEANCVVLPGDDFDELIRKTKARKRLRSVPRMPCSDKGIVCDTQAVGVVTEPPLAVNGMLSTMDRTKGVPLVIIDSDDDNEEELPGPPESPTTSGGAPAESNKHSGTSELGHGFAIHDRMNTVVECAPSNPSNSGSNNLLASSVILENHHALGSTCPVRASEVVDREVKPEVDSDAASRLHACKASLASGDSSPHTNLGVSPGRIRECSHPGPLQEALQGAGTDFVAICDEQIDHAASQEPVTPSRKRLHFDSPPPCKADGALTLVQTAPIVAGDNPESPNLPRRNAFDEEPCMLNGSESQGMLPSIECNELESCSAPSPSQVLTPLMRERIERNRLRALALQRQRNNQPSRDETPVQNSPSLQRMNDEHRLL
jgi:hypothetical protein